MASLVTVLRGYAAVGLAATALAVRRSEPARLFGIGFPGTVTVQALTIGTGLSAPLPLLAAVAIRAPRLDRRAVTALCTLFTVGALGEPATWRSVRSPRRVPAQTALAVASVALPVGALALGRGR